MVVRHKFCSPVAAVTQLAKEHFTRTVAIEESRLVANLTDAKRQVRLKFSLSIS